jgi:hypothetical protein
LPLKGGFPLRSTYKMIPQLQMSDFSPSIFS